MLLHRYLRAYNRSQSHLFLCRRYVSNVKTPLSPQHSIYISNSTDPYFNLTLEDWLFRHKSPDGPLLLIYRDTPCVIIGRNQNPWKEVNFSALHARPGVPFIRRRSGGGTVYHDLGNTNFSIHLPRATFDRHVTAQIVLRAVRSLGIPQARVNDRNDICVGLDKVSGSAYKIVNNRAYHHGTMLISTRLDTLGDLLRTNKETMITRGVSSVRSPVCNLQQSNAEITHDTFTKAVVTEFRKEYGIDVPEHVCFVEDTDEVRSIDYIQKGMSELPSWDWAYGQTPEFTYTIENSFAWGDVRVQIRSKHGVILDCKMDLQNSQINTADVESVLSFCSALEGRCYGTIDVETNTESDTSPKGEVMAWLQAIISS